MRNMLATFNQIHAINGKYKLSIEAVDQQIKDFTEQKVTIPIVGKFSTGKTALINAFLGYRKKLLHEDVDPETAVPTEICFTEGDEEAVIEKVDGTSSISIQEFTNTVFDFKTVKSIRLKLNKRSLSPIKDVMLVDMPGFESGYEVHNKAIDAYLPQSLAYLIAFSAEDMTLKYNMISILKELALNDMPVCIVITKEDKVATEILQENLKKLKSDLEKHLGKRDLRFCITSSSEGEIAELIEFLQELQEKSRELINKKYQAIAHKSACDTEMYINTLIKNQGLTMSELGEKEAALQKEMDEVKKSLAAQNDSFICIIPDCIREIKTDLLNALNREEATFIAMVLNGQDISERLNIVVRTTVTQSVKERFIPKVQRHIEDVAATLSALVSADGFISGMINVNTSSIAKNVVNTAVAAIGVIVMGPILALVGGVIAWFMGSKQKERERQAQKAQISQKLRSDVFPSVIMQINTQLETELNKHAEEISKLLTEEINNQYNTLSLALDEVVKQRGIENENKENFLLEANADLEELRGIKNECQ